MDLSSLTVAIAKCPHYGSGKLGKSFLDITCACPLPVNPRSAKVLLKPNLISARLSPLACTEGMFILAAAVLFKELGAHVVVGDSPAFGTAHSVLSKIGILADLKKLGVPVSDFSKAESVILKSGTKVGIAAEALNCDLLINLPRVKAHAQMRITLAVKNFFGCVVGLRKPYWHMKYGCLPGCFENKLVELLAVLPDSYTIVDAVTVMHKTGPINGKPFDLGLVAASSNPVALDSALHEIIRLPPRESPLMQACIQAGLSGTDSSRLEYPLHAPRDVRVDCFEVPETLHPVRFRPLRYIQSTCKRIILQKSGKERLDCCNR